MNGEVREVICDAQKEIGRNDRVAIHAGLAVADLSKVPEAHQLPDPFWGEYERQRRYD